MEITLNKKELNGAIRILSKLVSQTHAKELYRMIRFAGENGMVKATATDGTEFASVEMQSNTAEYVDFCVPISNLRELVKQSKESVVVSGEYVPFPEMPTAPQDATLSTLPDNFIELLGKAAVIVDRNGYRQALRGINLSPSGITVSDGKQLLNIPCEFQDRLTVPFPAPLLAINPNPAGSAKTWQIDAKKHFLFEFGSITWGGVAISSTFPQWEAVIPDKKELDCTVHFKDSNQVMDFLKQIPHTKDTNCVNLTFTPESATLSSERFNLKRTFEANVNSNNKQATLCVDREFLLYMMTYHYSTIRFSSEKTLPIVANGGDGCYVAMPIHTTKPKSTNQQKETKKMEGYNNVVEPIAPVVTPLDELNSSIEELRSKLKALLEESTLIMRKAREVSIAQKQKERDFIQAKRAIERIRMAI